MQPVIYWVRRDFRLSDNAALRAACDTGRPVIPVFICDEVVTQHGAAPKFRLGEGVRVFAQRLEQVGARLILRRGNALDVIETLVAQTGAQAVYWNRLYDPASKTRDVAVKAALTAAGVEARSFAGHLLFEPWTVETKQGGFYKVYSPFWKAVRSRDLLAPLPQVTRVCGPENWPDSAQLAEWRLDADMRRGRDVVAEHIRVGENAAAERLGWFVDNRIGDYKDMRDFPAQDATSRMSEPLTYGEISPATCWQAGWRAVEEGKPGAEHFLKELVWREFAYHLAHHTPRIMQGNWREEWGGFPWQTEDTPEVIAWKQGRTGIAFVDAAMREMFVTGTMHNRARMIVASYLTKHLMTHWQVGLRWFEDCLTDWDPASNAMGWQWVAGCGPDAAPYFRVFNPDTQADKFDRDQAYRRRWIAEGQGNPPSTARSYFDAVPHHWALRPDAPYPQPIVGLAEGRQRALAAYAHNYRSSETPENLRP